MDDFEKQVKELLDRAMQQPGVADILQAFNDQSAAIAAHEQAQRALAPRWIISSSASSTFREV